MRNRGFSLLEVLVSMAILALLVIGFLSLFDTSVRVSKVQGSIAESQDSLRYAMGFVTRTVRMAGSGGLPPYEPGGATVATVVVQNNVPDGISMTGKDGKLYKVSPGSDILQVRGAFWSQIYDLAPDTFDTTTSTFMAPETSRISGDTQNFDEMEARITAGGTVLALVASTQQLPVVVANNRSRMGQLYGALCVTGITDSTDDAGQPAKQMTFTTTAGTNCPQSFLDLNPSKVFPSQIRHVMRMVMLDDIWLFVGPDPETGAATLFMRQEPDIEVRPIASDIVDLQVALGCDANGDGQLQDDRTNTDEWIFNVPGDTITMSLTPDGLPAVSALTLARVTLVARASAERTWTQTPIENEDGPDVVARAGSEYMGAAGARYRYRAMREQIKLRSLAAIQ